MGVRAVLVQCAVASVAALCALAGPAAAQGGAPPDDAAREAELMAQLREAENPHAAALIQTEIAAIWSRSGSPAIDLLLRRGQEALEAGDRDAAVEHLTAAIDHDPAFAEAYAARAAAYYLSGDVGPAIDDLRQALVLNPNHWPAMKGFAAILEEMGLREEALEVWRRVTEINPQDAEAEAQAARLALALEGRAL